MRDSKLKSLGVSQDEIKVALVRERRRGVRRRLVAIGEILAGNSIKQAARAARAGQRSVERWLDQVRRRGFQSLLVDGRHGHARRRMKPPEAAQARRQIAAALARTLRPQVRARLIAIEGVLSGQPLDEVAASARVLPNAVKSWLRAVIDQEFAVTLARWEGAGVRARPRLVDADPASLRELAAKERNPRVRKRMLALAFVADGRSPHDAGMRSGLTPDAVPKWIARFRKEGVAGFRDRKISGRPGKWNAEGHSKPAPSKMSRQNLNARKPRAASGVKNARGRPRKLNATQLEELHDYVLKRPEVSFWRLHRLVWNRFRVRHSHASLKRLLKTEFGIEWAGASKKLGEGLNLAELQAAVANATDWRIKKRLSALLQLAKGRGADTVARSSRVHLETLRRWAKRYHAHSTPCLRDALT